VALFSGLIPLALHCGLVRWVWFYEQEEMFLFPFFCFLVVLLSVVDISSRKYHCTNVLMATIRLVFVNNKIQMFSLPEALLGT